MFAASLVLFTEGVLAGVAAFKLALHLGQIIEMDDLRDIQEAILILVLLVD